MLTVNNNQTPFTANLSLRGVKTNLKQWQQAGAILEQKTPKLNYTLHVNEYPDGVSIYSASQNGLEHSLGLSDKCLETLIKMTPEKMAEKLAKLVRLFAKEDKENTKIIKFLTHLEKSKSAPEDLFVNNYAYLAEINNLDTRAALSKDKVFRDCEYII